MLSERPTDSSPWDASHVEQKQDVISNRCSPRVYICSLGAFLPYTHVSIQNVAFVVMRLVKKKYWAVSTHNLAQNATVERAYSSYIHIEIVEWRIYEYSAQAQPRIFSGTKKEVPSRISANHFMNYISFLRSHILK
jgi:hypothetical protein